MVNDECPTPVKEGGAKPSLHHSSLPTRRVWDNPVIWREIRTWAYGRRILVVRLAYLALYRHYLLPAFTAYSSPCASS